MLEVGIELNRGPRHPADPLQPQCPLANAGRADNLEETEQLCVSRCVPEPSKEDPSFCFLFLLPQLPHTANGEAHRHAFF